MLADFGDDPQRHTAAKVCKNYAGASPITRQSGKTETVPARHLHQDRLLDALNWQALAALSVSPGARAYYDELRARAAGHAGALHRVCVCLRLTLRRARHAGRCSSVDR